VHFVLAIDEKTHFAKDMFNRNFQSGPPRNGGLQTLDAPTAMWMHLRPGPLCHAVVQKTGVSLAK
jgi:hypothetical protein